MHFKDFNFHPALIEGIESAGYETPTPIQAQVIPAILEGKDVIASAQTGTGKTAAFLLPLINKLLDHTHEGHVGGLILVPTRELAIQISQHMEGLSYFTNISSTAIYGGNDGQSFVAEKKALQMGADIIVCTPGRLIAHLNMNYFHFEKLQFLVLDEADRMLDMGFQDDINKIIKKLPQKKQTLLFSATMPGKIRQLAERILINPVMVNIALSKPPEKITQLAYIVYDEQKLPLIRHLLSTRKYKSALIFCSRKHEVKTLTRTLKKHEFNIGEIHSDLEQAQREDTLNGFTSGRIPILVATDILSRGIDIDTIDLVINYDIPNDGEDYVHRIGRTARAEAEGTAITFVGPREQSKFHSIEQLIDKEVEKALVPAELGPTPSYSPRVHSHKRPHGKKFHKRPSQHPPRNQQRKG